MLLTANVQARQITVEIGDNQYHLRKLISESSKYQITSLRIEGRLNADDVYFLRDMTRNGNLDSLDLSEAVLDYIVSDGDHLFKDSQRSQDGYLAGCIFKSCNRLKNIVLPNSVKRIGDRAFEGCSNLTSLEFNSLDQIGMYAFQGCTGLSSLTLNKVKEIQNYAFQGCTGLTSLTLNEVGSIWQCAFKGCTGLTSLTLNEVKDINSYAFQECCTELSSLILNKVGYIAEYAFEKFPNIKSISLERKVIPNDAFKECTKLESVSLTDVEYIRESAFKECTNLKSVDIITGGSTLVIGDSAFYKCENLQKASIRGEDIGYIGNAAFAECSNLGDFSLTNVNNVGDYAFAKCHNVLFNADDSMLTKTDIQHPFANARKIGAFAFSECYKFKFRYYLRLEKIGVGAFSGCDKMGYLNLDSPALEEIPDSGIGCGSNLTYLSLPGNLKYMGRNAFLNCSNLRFLFISDGTCEDLNVHTFDGTNLERVYIGNSKIDYTDVFANSDKIGINKMCQFVMYYTSTVPKLTKYIFSDTNNVILYVPLGTYSDYKSSYWGNASKILEYTTTEIKETEFKSSIIKPVIYSIDGKQTNMNEKGLKILRYPNGTSKKVIVK